MSGKLGCVGENGGGPRLKLARVVIVRSLEDGLRSEIYSGNCCPLVLLGMTLLDAIYESSGLNKCEICVVSGLL